MTELIEKSLGSKGVEYVKSCLRQGRGLSSMLLPVLVSGGETFAPVPKGTEQDRAEEFNVGGLMSRREMKGWLADHLESLCRAEPRSSILFQDLWAAPNDPAVRSATSNKLLTDSEVYYFIQAERFDSRLVEKALNELTSYLLVGVFTRFQIKLAEQPKDRLVAGPLIGGLAQETQEIFVGAYDQEGVVVWRR